MRNPPPDFDLESFEVFARTGLLAPERVSGIRRPECVERADLGACASCRRCVAVCPSDALVLEFAARSPLDELLRFEVDSGRCIGCGECVRVCPDALLEMKVADARVGRGARPSMHSLVGDAASTQGS